MSERRLEAAYRQYTADCLHTISVNAARLAKGEAVSLKYSEYLHPKPADRRTAEQIVADVIAGAGLEVIDR